MVIWLFGLAEMIEAISLDRARNAIRGLMALAPETATVRQADLSWLEMRAQDVAVGATVRVKPGERVATRTLDRLPSLAWHDELAPLDAPVHSVLRTAP